jgi:phage-Barnase-EndoU-ColicinE5/D-RelE like nuclease3
MKKLLLSNTYSYGVNHAIKKHGNPKTEESRGQVAITEQDFELIPQIVANPDSIELFFWYHSVFFTQK